MRGVEGGDPVALRGGVVARVAGGPAGEPGKLARGGREPAALDVGVGGPVEQVGDEAKFGVDDAADRGAAELVFH